VRGVSRREISALLESWARTTNGNWRAGPMPMKLEPWPGGRCYRDWAAQQWHFWGVCRPSSGRHCSQLRGAVVNVLSRRFGCAVPLEPKIGGNMSSFITRRSA